MVLLRGNTAIPHSVFTVRYGPSLACFFVGEWIFFFFFDKFFRKKGEPYPTAADQPGMAPAPGEETQRGSKNGTAGIHRVMLGWRRDHGRAGDG